MDWPLLEDNLEVDIPLPDDPICPPDRKGIHNLSPSHELSPSGDDQTNPSTSNPYRQPSDNESWETMPLFSYEEISLSDLLTGRCRSLENQYNPFEAMPLFRHFEGSSYNAPLNHLEDLTSDNPPTVPQAVPSNSGKAPTDLVPLQPSTATHESTPFNVKVFYIIGKYCTFSSKQD